MMNARRPIGTALAALLAFVLATEPALLSAGEGSLWSDRRRAMSAPKPQPTDSANNTLLASLPAISNPVTTGAGIKNTAAGLARLDLAGKVPEWIQTAVTPFATIQSARLAAGKDRPTVIIVQDAHLHNEAQHHIGGVIEALGKESKSSGAPLLVGLEGAPAGDIDLSTFRGDDAEIQKQVAWAMEAAHLLTGAEAAAISNLGTRANPSELLRLVGTESKDLYDANVTALRDSVPFEKSAAAALEDLRRELVELKKKHFDPDLTRFDGRKDAYEQGTLSLPDYALYLDSVVTATEPNLRDLIEAALIEGSLKFDRVERERKELLSALVPKLSEGEVKALLQASLLFRAGQLGYAAYYDQIKSLAERHGLPLAKFPEMNVYIQYVLKSEAIDHKKLFDELRRLEAAVERKLAQNEDQRAVVALVSDYHAMKKLSERALIESEWHALEARRPELDRIVERLAALGGGKPQSLVDMQPKWATFAEFYVAALKRNQAMTDNFANAVEKSGGRNAVMVVGGFHSEGLASLLEKRDLNVLVLSPKITKINDGPSSLEFLAAGRLPLDELFAGEKLFLTTPVGTAVAGEATVLAGTLNAAAKVAADPTTNATAEAPAGDSTVRAMALDTKAAPKGGVVLSLSARQIAVYVLSKVAASGVGRFLRVQALVAALTIGVNRDRINAVVNAIRSGTGKTVIVTTAGAIAGAVVAAVATTGLGFLPMVALGAAIALGVRLLVLAVMGIRAVSGTIARIATSSPVVTAASVVSAAGAAAGLALLIPGASVAIVAAVAGGLALVLRLSYRLGVTRDSAWGGVAITGASWAAAVGAVVALMGAPLVLILIAAGFMGLVGAALVGDQLNPELPEMNLGTTISVGVALAGALFLGFAGLANLAGLAAPLVAVAAPMGALALVVGLIGILISRRLGTTASAESPAAATPAAAKPAEKPAARAAARPDVGIPVQRTTSNVIKWFQNLKSGIARTAIMKADALARVTRGATERNIRYVYLGLAAFAPQDRKLAADMLGAIGKADVAKTEAGLRFQGFADLAINGKATMESLVTNLSTSKLTQDERTIIVALWLLSRRTDPALLDAANRALSASPSEKDAMIRVLAGLVIPVETVKGKFSNLTVGQIVRASVSMAGANGARRALAQLLTADAAAVAKEAATAGEDTTGVRRVNDALQRIRDLADLTRNPLSAGGRAERQAQIDVARAELRAARLAYRELHIDKLGVKLANTLNRLEAVRPGQDAGLSKTLNKTVDLVLQHALTVAGVLYPDNTPGLTPEQAQLRRQEAATEMAARFFLVHAGKNPSAYDWFKASLISRNNRAPLDRLVSPFQKKAADEVKRRAAASATAPTGSKAEADVRTDVGTTETTDRPTTDETIPVTADASAATTERAVEDAEATRVSATEAADEVVRPAEGWTEDTATGEETATAPVDRTDAEPANSEDLAVLARLGVTAPSDPAAVTAAADRARTVEGILTGLDAEIAANTTTPSRPGPTKPGAAAERAARAQALNEIRTSLVASILDPANQDFFNLAAAYSNRKNPRDAAFGQDLYDSLAAYVVELPEARPTARPAAVAAPVAAKPAVVPTAAPVTATPGPSVADLRARLQNEFGIQLPPNAPSAQVRSVAARAEQLRPLLTAFGSKSQRVQGVIDAIRFAIRTPARNNQELAISLMRALSAANRLATDPATVLEEFRSDLAMEIRSKATKAERDALRKQDEKVGDDAAKAEAAAIVSALQPIVLALAGPGAAIIRPQVGRAFVTPPNGVRAFRASPDGNVITDVVTLGLAVRGADGSTTILVRSDVNVKPENLRPAAALADLGITAPEGLPEADVRLLLARARRLLPVLQAIDQSAPGVSRIAVTLRDRLGRETGNMTEVQFTVWMTRVLNNILSQTPGLTGRNAADAQRVISLFRSTLVSQAGRAGLRVVAPAVGAETDDLPSTVQVLGERPAGRVEVTAVRAYGLVARRNGRVIVGIPAQVEVRAAQPVTGARLAIRDAGVPLNGITEAQAANILPRVTLAASVLAAFNGQAGVEGRDLAGIREQLLEVLRTQDLSETNFAEALLSVNTSLLRSRARWDGNDAAMARIDAVRAQIAIVLDRLDVHPDIKVQVRDQVRRTIGDIARLAAAIIPPIVTVAAQNSVRFYGKTYGMNLMEATAQAFTALDRIQASEVGAQVGLDAISALVAPFLAVTNQSTARLFDVLGFRVATFGTDTLAAQDAKETILSKLGVAVPTDILIIEGKYAPNDFVNGVNANGRLQIRIAANAITAVAERLSAAAATAGVSLPELQARRLAIETIVAHEVAELALDVSHDELKAASIAGDSDLNVETPPLSIGSVISTVKGLVAAKAAQRSATAAAVAAAGRQTKEGSRRARETALIIALGNAQPILRQMFDVLRGRTLRLANGNAFLAFDSDGRMTAESINSLLNAPNGENALLALLAAGNASTVESIDSAAAQEAMGLQDSAALKLYDRSAVEQFVNAYYAYVTGDRTTTQTFALSTTIEDMKSAMDQYLRDLSKMGPEANDIAAEMTGKVAAVKAALDRNPILSVSEGERVQIERSFTETGKVSLDIVWQGLQRRASALNVDLSAFQRLVVVSSRAMAAQQLNIALQQIMVVSLYEMTLDNRLKAAALVAIQA